MDKITALSEFLGCDAAEVTESDIGIYSYGDNEYLVLTDVEADEKTRDYMKLSVWAFRADWLIPKFKKCFQDITIEIVEKMQREMCEDANDILKGMIDDFDFFVSDSVLSDGRGHFLACYDGDENEIGNFFVYRVN